MKVLVPIKHVGSLQEEPRRPGATSVDRSDLDWSINEWDEFSVEAALQLREAAEDGEVVVVTVGDDEIVEGLVNSLARGADRAVRIWDQSLADADPFNVARVLAAVVARERPDVVLCGAKSSDHGHGATGVATAALAGLAHVAVVSRVQRETPTSLLVTRELGDGRRERLRARLPALLTLQTGINEPRYVALPTMASAASRAIEVLGLADLGLGSESMGPRAYVRRRFLAPEQVRATMLPATPAEAAAAILQTVSRHAGARVVEAA